MEGVDPEGERTPAPQPRNTAAEEGQPSYSARQKEGGGALKPFFWAFSGKWVKAVAQIGVMVVLARLLVPEEFGLVTAALVVVGFFRKVAPSATILQAIVQKPDVEEADVRTAFTLAILSGVVTAGATVLLGPLVASFFRMEGLVPLVAVAGLCLLLDSGSAVSEGLITRRMMFKEIARVDVVSYVVGYGLIGIAMGFMGFGAWALIVANVAQSAIRTILLVMVSPHPAAPMLERDAAKYMFSFSGGLSVASVFAYFALHGDNMIVARFLGSVSLGLYSRAYGLVSISSQLFGQVLDQVLLPVLSGFQGDAEATARAFKRATSLLATLTMPLALLTSSLASHVVPLLYGPGWEGAIGPLQFLGLGVFFRSGYRVSESLAKANGAVFRQAWRRGVYAGLVLAGAIVGVKWGLAYVAAGVTIALLANYVLMYHLAAKISGLGVSSIWETHRSGLLVCLMLAPLILLFDWSGARLFSEGFLQHVVVVSFSGMAYIGLLAFAPRSVLGDDIGRIAGRVAGLVQVYGARLRR